MNTSHLAAFAAALASACLSPNCFADSSELQLPVGSLTASPGWVREGVKPQLTWSITYPEVVTDLVEIEEPGTICAKVPVNMDVRVIGASVKAVWTDSLGKILKWQWVPTEARISLNGGSYSRIFYNTQDQVNPNTIIYSKSLSKGNKVDFGGRYYFQSLWSHFYTTTNGNYNVVALVNGDVPPTTVPLYQQPTIESFIKPYLDEEGRIKIGPKDVIYLMELTHTDRNDGGFDLQDLALIVTFTKQ
ncbi:hypothetical protein JIN85_00380 [Luteolibacter pohnpeiensis]|uniref:Uncharacterized protein n=2 Tax=Luteolibacter pohnpeiensis TaxID=454153 RepID=A0A934S443_9BACT|nr:hypothetical protein [Luteolibacter pohnpeiensis]